MRIQWCDRILHGVPQPTSHLTLTNLTPLECPLVSTNPTHYSTRFGRREKQHRTSHNPPGKLDYRLSYLLPPSHAPHPTHNQQRVCLIFCFPSQLVLSACHSHPFRLLGLCAEGNPLLVIDMGRV